MKTASPRIPSYRFHKPTKQAVVTLNGKDYYLGQHGTADSRERYDRIVEEWLASGRRRPEAEAPADLTITELIARFLTHAASFYRRPDG